jgi:hypothetical protein
LRELMGGLSQVRSKASREIGQSERAKEAGRNEVVLKDDAKNK